MKTYFANANSVVVDSNIFIKLLHAEHDTLQAIDFLTYCVENDVLIVSPTLLKYEIISVCVKLGISLDEALLLLSDYLATNLRLEEPSFQDWQIATKICQDGHQKSGYPSMYDSIYQAIAINKNIPFITADNRHYQKAQKHGNIGLLENWQSVLNIE